MTTPGELRALLLDPDADVPAEVVLALVLRDLIAELRTLQEQLAELRRDFDQLRMILG